MQSRTRLIRQVWVMMVLAFGASAAASSVVYNYQFDSDMAVARTNGVEGKAAPTLTKLFMMPAYAGGFDVRIVGFDRAELDGPGLDYQASDVETTGDLLNFSKPVRIRSINRFRGHQMVELEFWPIVHDSQDGKVYRYDNVEFEIIWEESAKAPAVNARYDDWTVKMLKSMVANPEDVPMAAVGRGMRSMSASLTDSIPCIIITNEAMEPVFQDYADLKTRSGTNTKVITVETIQATYPPDTVFPGYTLQGQIRDCIRDYYNDYYTDWVILGGDLDVIPGVYAEAFNDTILVEMYYQNLDGTWNEDGDSLFGEPPFFGDSTDYTPEVFSGRLPCSDSSTARGMINKIISYIGDTTEVGYQTQVLLTASVIGYSGDGQNHVEGISAFIPEPLFTKSSYYQQDSMTVMAAWGQGPGLIVNTSQASHAGNIQTMYSPHWLGIRGPINYTFFDTVTHVGKYGVFFNNTCWNADLTDWRANARHYLQNPNGGGVAYIGNTSIDWPLHYSGFHHLMFGLMFDSSVTELGRVLTQSRLIFMPDDPWDNGLFRHAMFGFAYFGDPQMRIWTDTPKKFETHWYSPQDLVSRHPVTIADFLRGPEFVVVPDVKVCLMQGSEVYEIGTTDANGGVSFDVMFPTHGPATLVASKEGYFYSEVEVMVYCCWGIRGNADYDIGESVDVGDLDYIVAWLFAGGPPPVCFEEGDVDGTGGIDVSDMGYLVDYLFREGPAPPLCP